MRPAIAALLLLPILFAACDSPCNREACESLRTPANDTGATRVAGVVVLDSDQLVDGCASCEFTDADVRIWKADGSTTWSELRTIRENPELASTQAEGRYEFELPPGDYLLCIHEVFCFDVTLVEGATTTLNVRINLGAYGYLGEGGSTQLLEVETVY